MILNKVYNLHVRRFRPTYDWSTAPFGANGGMTFAWTLTESGIQIGFPAICSEEDTYNKSVGSRIARDNLQTKDVYLFIPRSKLLEEAHSSVNHILEWNSVFNPTHVVPKLNELKDLPLEDLMCTSWFEQKVRQHIVHNDKRVTEPNKYVI